MWSERTLDHGFGLSNDLSVRRFTINQRARQWALSFSEASRFVDLVIGLFGTERMSVIQAAHFAEFHFGG